MEIPVFKRRLVIRFVDEGAEAKPSDASGDAFKEPRDLLQVHRRKSAAALLILAVAIFSGSFAYGKVDGLPSTSFDWLFGLQVIRAGVAFAVIAVLIAVIARGWGGLWPRRVGTTGLEFPEATHEVATQSRQIAQIVRALIDELGPEAAETRDRL
jgi:hypothetical protein